MSSKEKIWLSSPHMGNNERSYVQDVFDSNWIAPLGKYVDGFEKDLAEFNGAAHAAALSSGTAAIHLSLVMLGVEAGDEVICQSFTFSASANPITYLGATPVFVDSEPGTWNMSPDYLRLAINDRLAKGKKVRAIIPVHLYGMPARISEIVAIANEYNIPVIEDAAEALGSKADGKACGTFGLLGILSFNGNKIITTSGGGALLSDNEVLIKKARFLATQARDPAPHYQHSSIGYNYRLSNVLAAIGRGQMEVLPERIAQRRKNYDRYKNEFSSFKGMKFLEESPSAFSNRWLTCILIDPAESNGITREDLRVTLERENIEARPLWKPMHLQPVFEIYPYYGEDVAERLFDTGLCLPSGSNLTESDLQRVTGVIKELYNSEKKVPV